MTITSTKKKILVIDDAQGNIQTIIALLKADYSIEVALNEKDALKSVQSDKSPDLILLDVAIPGINVNEVCQQLKANNHTKDIPIIFVASADEINEEAKGLELGAVDYVTKPYNPNLLKARIQNLLRWRSVMLEVKDQARELIASNTKLKKLSEAKSEFLQMAAHDLNSPLTVISGMVALLLEMARTENGDTMISEKSIEMLDTIRNSAEHMSYLVKDLLENEELESGRIKLNLRPQNIARLVRDVCMMNKTRAESKGIKLEIDTDDYCMTTIDTHRILEVVDNLLSNAIKFTPPDKSVSVKVFRTPGNLVSFSVKDEGPGLTAEDKAMLFGKFVKLSARPTGNEHSTGLGLSIVKKLVELHGGEINVESDFGHGTTFTVTLATDRNKNSKIDSRFVSYGRLEESGKPLSRLNSASAYIFSQVATTS